MDNTLSSNESICYDLVETLVKNVAVLKTEAFHYLKVTHELERKLNNFNVMSKNLLNKLQSLWDIAMLSSNENNKIKEFADNIYASWNLGITQVREEFSKIRIASRTLPGAALSTLVEKLKKHAATVKVSLQIAEVIYDEDYIQKGYSLFNEVLNYCQSLEECDNKVQQYLAVCKLTPRVLELESAVDRFVLNVDLLSTKDNNSSSLSVFSYVSKLLTGELFGLEVLKPNEILFENSRKKPIIIVKNK
ncbi:uncharacterized protein [Prorops nasuta]|uniref:uncharacterized protein n=1 Tax=Prorops nasuta TaxID=863751 RepID=UPI0034CEFC41